MRIIAVIVPLLLAFGPFDSPKGLVADGNRLFAEKEYGRAMERYNKGLGIAKDDAPIHYNRGNVFYREGDTARAAKEYEKAETSTDRSLRSKTHYNIGNVLYLEGRYGEAGAFYREVLKHNPSDEDAKVNLEMTLKKLEEAGKGKEEDERGKEGDKNEKHSNPQGEDGAADGEEGEPEGKMKGKDREMTKEEAERLLGGLGIGNLNLQNPGDMIRNAVSDKVEKDW